MLEDDAQKSEVGLKAMGSKAKWRGQEAIRELRTQLAQARTRLILLKRMATPGTITVELSQTPKAVTPAPVTNGEWRRNPPRRIGTHPAASCDPPDTGG